MSRWLRLQRRRARALLRGRRYSVRRGRVRVPIASLVSPLRYDIVVRRDFLADLKQRLDAPLNDQVAWAKSTSYWTWFRDVRWQRASLRFKASRRSLDAAFVERVREAVALCRSFAARGFDPRFPIELKSADRVLPTEHGKRSEVAFVAGGGCHRIALLWLAGARALEPDQYVVHHFAELAPLDNTYLLRALLAERPADYVHFVAGAYMSKTPADVQELGEFVSASAVERIRNLGTILRADGIVDVPECLGR